MLVGMLLGFSLEKCLEIEQTRRTSASICSKGMESPESLIISMEKPRKGFCSSRAE